MPDRRTLSGPILDQEAGKVEEKLKLKLRGRKATFHVERVTLYVVDNTRILGNAIVVKHSL